MKRKMMLFVIGMALCGMPFGCVAACQGRVGAGWIGRIQHSNGWGDKLLSPGNHECWGRDRMYIIETRDKTLTLPKQMVLLQKDQVNFGVVLTVTYTLETNKDKLLSAFDKLTFDTDTTNTNNNWLYTAGLDKVWETYGARVVNDIVLRVITPKSVEIILSNLPEVMKEIKDMVIEELDPTPIRIIGVSITDYDWPDFITKAQEKAKEAEIKKKQIEFENAVEMARKDNELKVALKDREIKATQAQTITDEIELIGNSLAGENGGRYLRWHEIKVYGTAANGPNNCIFLPFNLLGKNGGSFDLGHEAVMTQPREVLRKALLKK